MAGSTFKNWKEWAQEWGLSYHKPGMLSPAREWMAGPYRGYLVKFGWRGERHVAFYAMVRFTKTSDAATLRQRLVEDPELADLPGWKKIKPTQAALKPAVFPIAGGPPQVKLTVAAAVTAPLLVDDTTLLWTLPCPWRKPNARKLAEWIEKLVTSIGFLVRPLDGRCEECGGTPRERFVMVNEIPRALCDACQQVLVQKGQMAEQAYDQEEARHLNGALFAALAAAVGGALWAALAYYTQHMFALVAIGMALLVGVAYKFGAKKLDRTGQVIGVLFTLAGVVIGDVLFYAAIVADKRPDLGFKLSAGWFVFTRVLMTSPGDIAFSLLCGTIGAFYTARILSRPKFVPKIEQGEERKAA